MKKRIISILMALVMALSLLPAGALAAGLPFTDVKTSDWFYNDVKNAYDKGLINGKTATTFEPNSNLTYAEAVKLAACMNQRNATGMVTLVNGNPWYATYVSYAKDNGIISKDYDWNAKATRAGYMEIFANALPAANLKPVNNVPDGAIPDVPMSHPQADAIYTLYRAGILQGSDSRHSCKPNDNIKRSEVAAILTRMMDVKERISFSMAEEVEELTITAQPKDVICSVGDTAEYTVMAAGGKEPYTYTWQWNRGTGYSDLGQYTFNYTEGLGTATLKIKNVSKDALSWNGSFRCIITDADGNKVTSNGAKLSKEEIAPLTITTQPKDVATSIPAGSSAFSAGFTVEVTGGKAPYTYQWQYGLTTGNGWNDFKGTENWANPATVKQSGLLVGSSNADMLTAGYQFRCVITDADGNKVTTSAAKLTEKVAPLTIKTQPKDVTCAVGGTAIFAVEAAGGKAPYTYQWQTYRSDRWGNITGATAQTYTHKKVEELSYSVKIRCVITDSDGNTVTSNEAKVVKKSEPLTITTQPKDVTCSVGDTVTFSVAVAGGKAPYTYQWETYSRMKWGSLNGATSATYTYENVSDASFSSKIRCTITDADGNKVTSNEAKLVKKTEATALTITTQPKDVACSVGDTATYTVAVSGGKAPYTYTWQWNPGTGYSDLGQYTFNYTEGLATATLKIKNVSETALSWNGSFRCVITDADGNTVTSNEVKLTKTMTVSISEKYDLLTANVTGGVGSYTYQWTLNNKVIGSGSSIQAGANGTYTCTVTDSLGNTAKDSYRYAYYNH